MKRIINVLIFYQFLSCNINFAASGLIKTWTFDLLNLTTYSSNTDEIDLEMHVQRLGRGRYGFSGFFDVKQPVGDEVNLDISVKRSLNKDGPYSKLPFTINEKKLTPFMNNYYTTLIMPTAKECCVNAPVFQGKFVPPITPRRIEINECIMSTDSLPSIMMEGYYWVLANATLGKAELMLAWQTYVEANKFF